MVVAISSSETLAGTVDQQSSPILSGGENVVISQVEGRRNNCKKRGIASAFFTLFGGEPHSENDLEVEDLSLAVVIAEDNPEWLALIAKANLHSVNRQNKKNNKRGGGIALVFAKRSSISL